MKWHVFTLPVWLVMATCAHRPKNVASPETVPRLDVTRAPTATPGAQCVVVGERGAYVLTAGGEFSGAFAGAPRGDLGESGAARKWIDAVEIRALEGAGVWTLGLDDAGVIHRLRGAGGLETMNARLGLPPRVHHVHARGVAPGVVALGDDAAFVVERDRVTRIAGTGRDVAASASALALVRDDGVDLVDLDSKRKRAFPLEGVRQAALTDSGVLVVSTEDALYRENGSGELALRYEADASIGALSVEGERAWFADGARIGVLDERGVALSDAVARAPIERVAAAPSALWIVAGGEARMLVRPGDVWPADVERIVKTSCVPCHEAGGTGGLALTTPQAVRAHRDDVTRALASGAMPPRTRPIGDADRARLLDWVRGSR